MELHDFIYQPPHSRSSSVFGAAVEVSFNVNPYLNSLLRRNATVINQK